MAVPPPEGMNATLRANIARLRDRAERERSARPRSERVADAITDFAGSMSFVIIHLVVFILWIVVNLGWTPLPRFDPTFVVLAMEASVEAIFLSTFVLITQNRMAAQADRRAALDLHINLLAEHELTRLSTLVSRIAGHMGIEHDDPQFEEIKQDVQPERVLDEIDRQQP
jgi:uncharacterized membrane protein